MALSHHINLPHSRHINLPCTLCNIYVQVPLLHKELRMSCELQPKGSTTLGPQPTGTTLQQLAAPLPLPPAVAEPAVALPQQVSDSEEAMLQAAMVDIDCRVN